MGSSTGRQPGGAPTGAETTGSSASTPRPGEPSDRDSTDPPAGSPLVSVIVPTRNRRSWLGRALRSVAAQDHRPIELIVVDDGSEPAVEPICPVGDLSVHLVRRPLPGGPGAARNAGVGVARGELVCFLDDDDTWSPSRVSTAVRQIGAHRFHAMAVERADGGEQRVFEGDMRRTLEQGTFPLVGQVMFRRRDYRAFDPDVRVAEDTDWWLSMRSLADFAWSPAVGLHKSGNQHRRPGVDPLVRYQCRCRVAAKHLPDLSPSGRAMLHNRLAAGALLADLPGPAVRHALAGLRDRPTVLGAKLLARSTFAATVGRRVDEPVRVGS